MPKKFKPANKLEKKLVGPLAKAHENTVTMVARLRKKPGQRNPVYKPLDKYWPDI